MTCPRPWARSGSPTSTISRGTVRSPVRLPEAGRAARLQHVPGVSSLPRRSPWSASRTNAAATERAQPFQFIATLSSGYDSPTVTVLARRCRLSRGLRLRSRARGPRRQRCTDRRTLGVRYHPLETSAWRSEPLAAVPFLAALASGGSSVLYKGAESLARRQGRVHRVPRRQGLGHQADGPRLRARPDRHRGGRISPSTGSGPDSSTVRCRFSESASFGTFTRISTSDELAPWNVAADYNRPICRRIVEEQGVPREMFGVRKKATAQPLLRAEDFLTRDMRSDYYRWVRAQRHVWRGLRMEPPECAGGHALHRASSRRDARRACPWTCCRQASGCAGRRSACALLHCARAERRARCTTNSSYHWAVDRAKERYGDLRPLVRAA